MNNFAGRFYFMRRTNIRVEPIDTRDDPPTVIPASIARSMPGAPWAIRFTIGAINRFDRLFGIWHVAGDEQWFARAVVVLIGLVGAFCAGYWGVI